MWPVDDRVVVAGEEALIFVDPLAGQILVRRVVIASEADYDPRADELPRRDRFAHAGSWVTLEDGGVVATNALVDELGQQLGWGRRPSGRLAAALGSADCHEPTGGAP